MGLSFGQMGAVILLILLCLALFREWTLIALGVIGLLFLIRFIADIFWWGRDRGRW